MKSAVITFPGSNCDRDVAVAIKQIMGHEPITVWHQETELPDNLDFIAVPGGFSYGDYLRTGAMASHSNIMQAVKEAANKGMLVLGICNGFQILCEMQLLPGVLIRNANLKFICKDVCLRVEEAVSFTSAYKKNQVISVPIAHGEGNYFADDNTLDYLENEGSVAFRYCSPAGEITSEYNVNGSRHNIAGIFNKEKNVLGMMPHPERAIDPLLGGVDGRLLFESIMK